MPSQPTLYQVPFSEEGHQLHYASYTDYYSQGVKWVDNFKFIADLTIKDFQRGRSAAYFNLEDQLTGVKYTMFMKDMVDLITKGSITQGVAHGEWTFQKRGSNFGVKAVSYTQWPL